MAFPRIFVSRPQVGQVDGSFRAAGHRWGTDGTSAVVGAPVNPSWDPPRRRRRGAPPKYESIGAFGIAGLLMFTSVETFKSSLATLLAVTAAVRPNPPPPRPPPSPVGGSLTQSSSGFCWRTGVTEPAGGCVSAFVCVPRFVCVGECRQDGGPPPSCPSLLDPPPLSPSLSPQRSSLPPSQGSGTPPPMAIAAGVAVVSIVSKDLLYRAVGPANSTDVRITTALVQGRSLPLEGRGRSGCGWVGPPHPKALQWTGSSRSGNLFRPQTGSVGQQFAKTLCSLEPQLCFNPSLM